MLLVLIALLALTAADLQDFAIKGMFDEWKAQHNKAYQSTQEHNYRLAVFAKNARFVHNWDAEARGFKVGLNAFADMTTAEFNSVMNGMNLTITPSNRLSMIRDVAPDSVDWRKEGLVTRTS